MDLLGREKVEINAEDVRYLVGGKRVLVTGGAGTIGSELCRQVARLSPARLVVCDVDESRLPEIAISSGAFFNLAAKPAVDLMEWRLSHSLLVLDRFRRVHPEK